MAARNPPPTYEETLGRGGQPRASPSNFASWGGRGSGTRGPAGSDYRSAGGRVAVPEDVSGDVAGSLRSGGFKVSPVLTAPASVWPDINLSWLPLLLFWEVPVVVGP